MPGIVGLGCFFSLGRGWLDEVCQAIFKASQPLIPKPSSIQQSCILISLSGEEATHIRVNTQQTLSDIHQAMSC